VREKWHCRGWRCSVPSVCTCLARFVEHWRSPMMLPVQIGDNGTETGFLRIRNVRIPRTWLLMKNQQVLEGTPRQPSRQRIASPAVVASASLFPECADGTYVKTKRAAESKLQYGTMLSIRAGLVMGAGFKLAQGATIVTRYSLVRQQGFIGSTTAERQVLDYQTQSYRCVSRLSLSHATSRHATSHQALFPSFLTAHHVTSRRPLEPCSPLLAAC
jgi:hypothetical protein